MLNQVLSSIGDLLNAYLTGENHSDEKVVVLSNITEHDGSIAAQVRNKIIMTLVGIEEETGFKNRQPIRPGSSGNFNQNPPFLINCYVLIAAGFSGSNYKTGLSLLSSVMNFFHQNPVFTPQNAPGLNPAIARLSLEIHNQDSSEMSQMWLALGAKYMPSVLFKMRILPLNDTNQIVKDN